jgi:hypothetical protein
MRARTYLAARRSGGNLTSTRNIVFPHVSGRIRNALAVTLQAKKPTQAIQSRDATMNGLSADLVFDP